MYRTFRHEHEKARWFGCRTAGAEEQAFAVLPARVGMRRRTAVAVLFVGLLLAGVLVVGLGLAPVGGSLEVEWLSDTPRENLRNHHAVGVGPDSGLVVAPVTAVHGGDVEVTNRSCSLVRLAPEDGAVRWHAPTPAESCFSHALTEPAIADIDGDGRLEAAVASTEEALVVHDGRTGTEEWRVPLSTYGYGRPTVTGDGPGADVVASDIEGNVVRVTGNGSVRWRVDTRRFFGQFASVTDRPLVTDVTGDGDRDVVVGSNRGVVVLAADGQRQWNRSVPGSYLAVGPDENGSRTVVTAYYRSVQALDGASGEVVWRRNVTSGRVREVTDADGDGTPEAYVGRVGGEVLALDARTGETEWSTTMAVGDGVIVAPPVTADVNGDGRPEVVAAAEAGRVVVLDPNSGEELATYTRDVPVWTFVTSADLDGDGDAELLVRYGDGRVAALDYAAGESFLPPVVAGGPQLTSSKSL
jgi:outer membrane protein assembly factor BamB